MHHNHGTRDLVTRIVPDKKTIVIIKTIVLLWGSQ